MKRSCKVENNARPLKVAITNDEDAINMHDSDSDSYEGLTQPTRAETLVDDIIDSAVLPDMTPLYAVVVQSNHCRGLCKEIRYEVVDTYDTFSEASVLFKQFQFIEESSIHCEWIDQTLFIAKRKSSIGKWEDHADFLTNSSTFKICKQRSD